MMLNVHGFDVQYIGVGTNQRHVHWKSSTYRHIVRLSTWGRFTYLPFVRMSAVGNRYFNIYFPNAICTQDDFICMLNRSCAATTLNTDVLRVWNKRQLSRDLLWYLIVSCQNILGNTWGPRIFWSLLHKSNRSQTVPLLVVLVAP